MVDAKEDQQLLLAAVRIAREGQQEGNQPYGAVVFRAGQIIAEACNLATTSGDRLSHAETNALDSACRRLGTSSLADCTLYCTSEPCILCVGAIAWTGVGRVVYGAADPVDGAIGELQTIKTKIEVTHVSCVECDELFAEITQKQR